MFAEVAVGLKSRLVNCVETAVRLLFGSLISMRQSDYYKTYKVFSIRCAKIKNPQYEGPMR